MLYAMEGNVGADAGVSEMQRAGIGAVMHARVAMSHRYCNNERNGLIR